MSFDDFLAEGWETPAAKLGEPAFGDDEGALPIIAAVEHDEQVSGLDASEDNASVLRALGEAQPQRIHGRAEILDLEAGKVAHRRVAPVGADHEIGLHVERPLRHLRPHAHHVVAVFHQIGDLGLHAQAEAWIGPRLVGEKIEKLPLRHEGDEVAARRQMREVGKHHAVLADLAGELAQLLMRPFEELIEQAELVHDLERRGMDRVAAEVAQEIGVLLEHHHLHAGAGEQIAQHHAGGPSSGDAAPCGGGFSRHAFKSSVPDFVIPAQAGIQRAKRIQKTGSRLSPG